MKLIEFIQQNENWQDALADNPYNLKIKQHPEHKDHFMFSYDMIRSNFHNEICREARGVILYIDRERKYIAVKSRAFNKFGNHGESYADKIDTKTMYVREKLDGSLIKLHFNFGKWIWTTNNGFDANVELPGFFPVCDEPGTRDAKTFQDLIDYALTKNPIDYDYLSTEMTYIFELTSPMNRIVVPYTETKLWLLGARQNITGAEFTPEELHDIIMCKGFDYPKKITTAQRLDMYIVKAAQLGADAEGFVVCDENFNRVKIKGPAYVTAHKIKGEQQLSYKHLFESLIEGTIDDILGIFPEYAEPIGRVIEAYNILYNSLKMGLEMCEKEWQKIIMKPPFDTHKKRYAAYVLPTFQWMQSAAFDLCKEITIDEAINKFVNKLDYAKFCELSGFKEA